MPFPLFSPIASWLGPSLYINAREKPNVAAARRFKKIHIEISNVCNLSCSFCPSVQREKGRISVAAFEKIVEAAAPLSEEVCLHLMGEPLLHPELESLVALCAAADVRIFLVSNGVLLRQRASELLLHPAFRQVNFSLHSFRDNFPLEDPKNYLERIFRFTEAAFEARPDLYINYRLWNLDDPRGATASNRDMLSAITERFGCPPLETLDVRRRKSVRLTNRLYLHFDTEFIWPGLERPWLGDKGRCYGLSSHIGILVDGTVVPCCLDKDGVIPLGNIHEEPLETILAGPRATAMREGFKRGQLVEALCQRCSYIERFA